MKLKNTIFIILTILTMTSIGAWFLMKNDIFNHHEKFDEKAIADSVVVQDSNEFAFVGDDAYLVKGKLTDENFRGAYEKLPDTLYQLEFADRIYAMEKNVDINNTGPKQWKKICNLFKEF